MIILNATTPIYLYVLILVFVVFVIIAYYFDYNKNPKYFKDTLFNWLEFILECGLLPYYIYHTSKLIYSSIINSHLF